MTLSACSLHQMHRYAATVVRIDDVLELRKLVAPQKKTKSRQIYNDELLLYAANSELCSTVGLAWCIDEHDPELLSDQKRFMAAYDQLCAAIKSTSNPVLRHSLELPEEYVRSIKNNFLLGYAKVPTGGRPVDWRKDAFYLRLLTLYRMYSGQQPAGTVSGPTVRFMRALVKILRRQLVDAADRNGPEYEKVERLWRLPLNDTFLKEWFRTKGSSTEIQRQVNFFEAANVAQFERMAASRPSRDNIIYAEFGGEKPIT